MGSKKRNSTKWTEETLKWHTGKHSTRRINKYCNDLIREYMQPTTAGLFSSLLARESRRHLEDSVLTKPCEAGHHASLPLGSQQNAFCLPTRALGVLTDRCHLVATLQAPCSRDSVLAALTCGDRGVRTETTGGILSPLKLLPPCRTRWAASTKSYFFHLILFVFHEQVTKCTSSSWRLELIVSFCECFAFILSTEWEPLIQAGIILKKEPLALKGRSIIKTNGEFCFIK